MDFSQKGCPQGHIQETTGTLAASPRKEPWVGLAESLLNGRRPFKLRVGIIKIWDCKVVLYTDYRQDRWLPRVGWI